jgi:FkbM family methyltransferase
MLVHYQIWAMMVKEGISEAIIFEEDIVFDDAFCSEMPKLWRQLGADWHILYLGMLPRHQVYKTFEQHDPRNPRYGGDHVQPFTRLPTAPWTTHAYAVSLPFAQLLTRLYAFFLARTGETNRMPTYYPLPVRELAHDPSWRSTYEAKKGIPDHWPWNWSLPIAKIDFWLITVYNNFLTNDDRRKWYGLQTSISMPRRLYGEPACYPFVMSPFGSETYCWSCNAWKDDRCTGQRPILGTGLVYQHKCKEQDVKQLKNWFDTTRKSCLRLEGTEVAITSEDPSRPENYPLVFSREYSMLITMSQWTRSPLVTAKVSTLPCWKKGNLQCCVGIPTLYVRPGTTDAAVLGQILLNREFHFLVKPQKYPELKAALSPSGALLSDAKFIVDAGANCGMSSVFLANLYPEALIVSLEAHPGNYLALKRNVAEYPNIKPLHAALWSRVTSVRVVKGNRHGREWDFQVQEVGNAADANTTDANTTWAAVTIDEVMARYSMPKIDFLKMDIEGSEFEVFTGPTLGKWLPRVQVIGAEVHSDMKTGAEGAINAALERHGPFKRTRLAEYVLAARPARRW